MKKMDESTNCIYELYLDAKRFDESETYQSKEYEELVSRKAELTENLYRKFISAIPLMEEFIGLLAEETELECRHFFREGYLAGQVSL